MVRVYFLTTDIRHDGGIYMFLLEKIPEIGMFLLEKIQAEML